MTIDIFDAIWQNLIVPQFSKADFEAVAEKYRLELGGVISALRYADTIRFR